MESLEFTKFIRVNEAVHPEKLQPDELVALENMRLDEEIGVATKRRGFSPKGIGGLGTINGLWNIYTCNDENYLVVNSGTTLKKSLNGTSPWEDIKTGLTPSKMITAPFGILFFFTNNNEKPFYGDVTEISNAVYDMEIERPDIASVVTDPSVFGGSYWRWSMWVICYVTDDGQKSNVSRKFSLRYPHDNSPYSVTISDLPVSTDERVISKYLYRTKDGDLSNFYLAAILDNSATEYTDTITDENLDTTETIEYLNTPFKSAYISTNNDRVLLANFEKYAANRIIPPEQYKSTGTSFVVDDTQAGNLTTGTYKYGLSFVDMAGNESELVPFFEYTLTSDNKRLDYSMIPFPVRSYTDAGDPTTYIYETSIRTVRMYRTKADGTVYYYLRDWPIPIPIGVDGYWDTYDDLADVFLVNAYPTTFNNEEVLILKSGVVFSNLNKPLEMPELNLIEIYPDDGDSITGMSDDDNGIMIFKEKSICKLYTNGAPENWYVKKLIENVGCDEPESIYKWGHSYFFMYQKRPYYFDGQSQPTNIGETRKTTFNAVTEIMGTTFWDNGQWYILAVKIGVEYYLLCYDTKLKGWYKFWTKKADSLTHGKYGLLNNLILIGGDQYVTFYDETKENDTINGIPEDIDVFLLTKDYAFPDNFLRARLMFLSIDYDRLIGTTTKRIYFKLVDPLTNSGRALGDEDEEMIQNIYKISTDGMFGLLKRCNKINFSIVGEAIRRFHSAKLEYDIEDWGNRRKTNIDLSGLGMDVGVDFGINE